MDVAEYGAILSVLALARLLACTFAGYGAIAFLFSVPPTSLVFGCVSGAAAAAAAAVRSLSGEVCATDKSESLARDF